MKNLVYTSTSLSGFLGSVLKRRAQKNRVYSMRSMALQLDLSKSMLSGVLNGTRSLSQKQILKLKKGLKLSETETDHLLLLSALEKAEGTEKEELRLRLHYNRLSKERKRIELDQFKVMSDWYHLALLEMTSLPLLEQTPKTYGQRLGLPEKTIETALERLKNLGLLHMNPDSKRLEKTSNYFQVEANESTLAVRSYYRQMLDRTARSILPETVQERCLGAENFPFSSTQVPEARLIIEHCMSELVALAGKCEKPDTIYHVGIQMFNLLNSERPKP